MSDDFNKSKDLEYFQKWKDTGSKEDLGNLVKQFEPLMFRQVRRLSGSVPPSALSAEAKKQAIIAFNTYDPDKGAALSTHVYNRLNKLKRINSKYQNAVRLPENQHFNFSDYNNTVERLKETLNRDPSDNEVASDLGWDKKEVKRFRERLYSDLYESGTEVASTHSKFDNTKILTSLVEESLDPQERIIWENVKKPKDQQKSVPDLAAELGVNVNRFQYIKSKLVKKIYKLQGELGDFS